MNQNKVKSGFVSIVGKPNSGKSTLLNQIFKDKISIATPKQNTTRNRINAIYTDSDSQISFIDTPGFLKVNNLLDERMKDIIIKTLKEVDVIVYMLNIYDDLDLEYLKKIELTKINSKKILVINKIDQLKNKELILQKIEKISKLNIFDEIIPISALKNINVLELVDLIKKLLPNDFKYYDEETSVLYSEQFYVSEIIREKILFHFSEEIPHEVFVLIDRFQKNEKLIKIRAEIVISRESLKKIIIGKDGNTIKSIGIKAREELEKHFNQKIFLELFVKIRKNWQNKESIIKTNY